MTELFRDWETLNCLYRNLRVGYWTLQNLCYLEWKFGKGKAFGKSIRSHAMYFAPIFNFTTNCCHGAISLKRYWEVYNHL